VKISGIAVKGTRMGDVSVAPRRTTGSAPFGDTAVRLEGDHMADVAFVAIIIAFFSFAALFVAFCDRVIGTDEEALADAPELAGADEERVAA
jgi:hypothetical protein